MINTLLIGNGGFVPAGPRLRKLKDTGCGVCAFWKVEIMTGSRNRRAVQIHWYQKIFQLLHSYGENELCTDHIWRYCFDSLILYVKV